MTKTGSGKELMCNNYATGGKKSDVCVLMTTYNPKEYVIEQVESILNQNDVNVHLIIRDDASTDKTYLYRLNIYSHVTIIEGEKNLGVQQNIMELIRYAEANIIDSYYFAYSDQDDVWKNSKLSTAVHILNSLNKDQACLYYSNLLVVDEHLNPSHELFKRDIVKNTFGQSLSQIFLFACTAVFNKKMLDLISSTDILNMGFDHFVYYLAILHGNTFYDNDPQILYRQHGDNVSGVKKKGVAYLLSKIKVLFEEDEYSFSDIANQLLHNMIQYMNEDEIKMAKQVAGINKISNRIKVITNKEIRAGYYPKDFYRFLRIIINKY